MNVVKEKTTITFEEVIPGYFLVMGVAAAVPIIRAFDISVFVWMELASAFLIVILRKVGTITRCDSYAVFMIAAVISTGLAVVSCLPMAYISNSLKAVILIIAIWLNVNNIVKKVPGVASSFVQGVSIGALANAIWMIFQFAVWRLFAFDLNAYIFNELLSITEVTSQYKATGLVATGLCWNVGGITAAILMGFVYFKNSWIRTLFVVAAILSQSRTLQIGLVCIIALRLGIAAINRYRTFSQGAKKKCHLLVVVVISFMFICATCFISKWLESPDSSGSAHLAYYANLPELLSRMDPLQFIFGYGVDCSGFPYTALTGQYHWLKAWFVESDIVNTLLGMGVVGLLALYFHILEVTKRLVEDKSTFALFIISVLVCGVFYNILSVTYYWALLLINSLPYASDLENGMSES